MSGLRGARFALRGEVLIRPRPRPRRRCTSFDFDDEDELNTWLMVDHGGRYLITDGIFVDNLKTLYAGCTVKA